jgi:UrcA family protein
MQQIQIVMIALAMTATPFATAAHAQTQSAHSVAVSYDDLDLARPDHARIMAERLDEAARMSCGGSPRFDPNYRTARAAATDRFEWCRTRALEAALAQLQAPLVARALTEDAGQG